MKPERARGISSAEAAERLLRDGPNELPAARPPSPLRQFLGQVTHFFAILLWAAGALAIADGMAELGVAIFVVVLVNGVFAFAQEHRAERAAERLRTLLPRRALVRRDGAIRGVEAAEIVREDVVLLGPGDRVSADLVLAEAHDLAIDTSMLTGESVPARVAAGDQVFAGTFVIEGEGAGIVHATGSATRIADIAALTRAGRHPKTPLALELARLVRVVAVIAVSAGAALFLAAVALGLPPREGFLLGIGVTVALVPEGLLPTVTLSLALGARRMAARRALVRRLEAVETLGSTTFICTDKTGTLTRNQMAVVAVWTPVGSAHVIGRGYEPAGTIESDPSARDAVRALALAAARCSTGRAVQRDGAWTAEGDPMEAAIHVLAMRAGVDVCTDETQRPVRRRFSFDPRRRRMSVELGERLIVKGAPDALLDRCQEPGDAARVVEELAGRGLRVLAIASRPAAAVPLAATADEAEAHLDLLGLLAFEDPPRPGAAEAIAACRRAGIRVAMITGDHAATARAIAAEVGLLGPDPRVVEGRALPRDDGALGALLDADGVVVCRVSPEDKLRIVKALQARGHVVAMTGDGVNDGPVLQQADIGVAMGTSGTDVAREAADLVLLDDDFATIVAAVEQGRATFFNVRRVLTYHLTDNVAELAPFVVWALSAGRFPLALGVLQILCLDLVTDQLPALALGAERPDARVLDRPPPRMHLADASVLGRAFGVLGPAEALVELLAFSAVLLWAGLPLGAPVDAETLRRASGAAFAAVVIGQAANAFACRSTTRWPGAIGWTSNRFLLAAVGFALAVLVLLFSVPWLARIVGHATPPAIGLLGALLTAPAVLIADTIQKRWRARKQRGIAALELRASARARP